MLTGGGDSLSVSLSLKSRFFFACVPELPGCGDTGGGVNTGDCESLSLPGGVTGGGVNTGDCESLSLWGVCGGGLCHGGDTGAGGRIIGESLSLTLFLGGVDGIKSTSLSSSTPP